MKKLEEGGEGAENEGKAAMLVSSSLLLQALLLRLIPRKEMVDVGCAGQQMHGLALPIPDLQQRLVGTISSVSG